MENDTSCDVAWSMSRFVRVETCSELTKNQDIQYKVLHPMITA